MDRIELGTEFLKESCGFADEQESGQGRARLLSLRSRTHGLDSESPP